MNTKAYTEHSAKAVEDSRFNHMMAIALDPSSGYKHGVIRCITSREGDVETKGYVDRSELYKISGGTLEKFIVGERLNIKNEKEILQQLGEEEWDFIGLEDPDIFIDEKTGLTHLYFTMPLISKDKTKELSLIHLGHAVGKNLDSLEMTMPALQADALNAAKEVSIAPINSKGVRYNLVESSSIEEGVWYSTVRVGIADDMNKPWQLAKLSFIQKNILFLGLEVMRRQDRFFRKILLMLEKENSSVLSMDARQMSKWEIKQSTGYFLSDYLYMITKMEK